MYLSKFDSLVALSEFVRESIAADDLDRGLRVIHDFVERIITEPLCTSQVYGSRELDALCQEIGRRSLSHIDSHRIVREAPPGHGVYVYVVTKLQNSGGHTRVIEEFIRARPQARHIVLSTELAGRSNHSNFMARLRNSVDLGFEAAPRGSFIDSLIWLQTRLLEIGANQTYLLNHHQDSVSVAAIQPEMGLDASYYHHGDHHLCLGVYLSHLEHIDPHPMGYHNCRDALGISNTYIPFALNDNEDRPASMEFMSEGYLTTCTAARSNKIEIPYFVSYLDVVPRLLKATGGKHVHIGRLSPWALMKIRRGLKRHGVGDDNFIYTPWVPSVWRELHKRRVDLYIASFPYGGGLTLIEAMGSGTPVALHRHMYSRVLSGVDIAYAEAFCWRYPDELQMYCSGIRPEDLRRGSRLARTQYEKYHRMELLVDLLNGRIPGGHQPSDLRQDFVPESVEWAAWMEKQLSCRRVVQRGAYRLFRAIRGRFF